MINPDSFLYSRLKVRLPLDHFHRELVSARITTHACSVESIDFETLNKPGELAPAASYGQVDLTRFNENEPEVMYYKTRGYPVWDVFNFTKPVNKNVPLHDYYSSGSFNLRDNFKEEHLWIDHPLVPFLREIGEKLFYKNVTLCRLMILGRGKFVPFHRDASSASFSRWCQHGLIRTNVVLPTQGGDFAMKVGEKIYKFSDDVFTFNDSFPHGVFQTSAPRISLVFFGEVDPQAYGSLLEQNF